MGWRLLLIVTAMGLSGCAHFRGSASGGSNEDHVPKTLSEILQEDVSHLTTSKIQRPIRLEDGVITVQGVKLKNNHFDFPITINSRVEAWMDYFCGRGRKYFSKYLERSEYFIPYILPILKQNGLPEDLVYLAMIESGFNNLARSKARAVGPWQFISATGKRYGLMVNWWVDERRDTGKATLAAVGYLKDLYSFFHSWELAAAAYNAGEAKIAHAVRRFGSKDFWVISQHRYIRPETRDYVPKIIAAAIISKNRTQFGFTEEKIKTEANAALAGDGELVKVVKTDKPLDDTDNAPAVNDSSTDEDQETDLEKIARGKDLTLDADQDGLPTERLASYPVERVIQTPHISKTGEVAGESLAEFEVQSPADLLKVARAAGLSYRTVKSLNPELLRWCTPPTMATFHIKLPLSTRERFLETYNHIAFPKKVQFMTYKAQRGDTLVRIARHFGIHVDSMSDLNRISPHKALRVGTQVFLPMPNDRSRTLLSLEVRDPPERIRKQRHRRARVGAKALRTTDRTLRNQDGTRCTKVWRHFSWIT